MKARLVAPALAGIALLATVLSGGTAGAASSTGHPICNALRTSYGHATFTTCTGKLITGTVWDDQADGKCPRVLVQGTNNDIYLSDWAGPKGDSSPIRMVPPTNVEFYGTVALTYINC